MKLTIYDTLERKKREFEPKNPERVTLYVCGPTVYNYAHIGNARPVVVFDVLYRLLRHIYGEQHVIYARNITDVDDKINKKAMDEGVDISVITNKFADIYNADMAALNALPPTYQPRATDHMPDMVAMIEKLIERQAAYVTDDGEVLFRVADYDAGSGRYGKLSGRSLDDMIAGARVEVAENKDDAADFVLWKPSKPGEPVWPGPRNPETGEVLPGRPGWHIECSAMSEAVLTLPIDIHGGGQDLIFPHHTNEIAQSCATHGHDDPAAYARYWMHNGFLDMSGEKMSKSLGNVVLVHDLTKQYPGEVIRWALLSGHYRSPLNWTPELLEQSKKNLDRLYGLWRRTVHLNALMEETASRDPMDHGFYPAEQQAEVNLWPLLDDLNTPQQLAVIFEAASALERELSSSEPRDKYMAWLRASIKQAADILGILQQDPEIWFKGGASDDLTAKVEALLVARTEARAAKNWAEADRIRDELNALKVEVMDSPTGATWKLKAGV
ncbi:cysteine--tRNA ligase [Asticcacaulis sp. SL142]|uniref:cysteine--tRNA ligase n=1 Tax=Asticcacaulis sp. SL142 TaxID=2995155 RepID=UPI00226C72A3|nr:cysteine--tRNA ligase [Asticcacaulis sp. SL142]WAC47073.1 cysteine--tRNA ligase [Asticcacaulis sp. SL142]